VKLVQGSELPRQQGDLVIEVALVLLIRSCGKEDKANSKEDD
jgi:hypothetical protein